MSASTDVSAPASGGFRRRLIRLTFNIAKGAGAPASGPAPVFPGTKANRVTLDGLRVLASVDQRGEIDTKTELRIYGLSRSIMNTLTTLGMTRMMEEVNQSSVTVEAGDSAGMSVVAAGTIFQAWADFQAMPNVVFHVSASAGMEGALRPVPPLSYSGGTDVGTLMGDIAKSMGYTLENNGVDAKLSNPYLWGTAMQQARSAARAAGINMHVDAAAKVLAIWPRGSGRKGTIPLISSATGMIGYPSYTPGGIAVRTVYNPGVRIGGNVRVESDLAPANGEWNVYGLRHELESETPGGQWSTAIMAALLGNSTPLVR